MSNGAAEKALFEGNQCVCGRGTWPWSAAGEGLFSRLSFEAGTGTALIVTGPNGAGKSSLLRALCGFLPVKSGGFALDGGDGERTVGEQAHYLGHADALKAR